LAAAVVVIRIYLLSYDIFPRNFRNLARRPCARNKV
jgi:hypothetical protein